MTPLLTDLTRALDYQIAREVEIAPPGTHDYACANAALERADWRERLLTVESDGEAIALVKKWLGAYKL